jgi:two-component system nitrate/nitrite sensor histidine kinase NarX
MKPSDADKKDAVTGAVVEERLRLSRELHDRALQLLTSARMRLDSCHHLLKGDPAALEKELFTIEDNLDRAVTEIRNLLAENRIDDQLQAGSLERRLKEELSIFSARSGFQIELRCSVDTHELPIAIEKELYFTLREGVLNAVRHARASKIRLTLTRDQSGYRASLSDNGVGFIIGAAEGSNHYGLKGMKERAEKLGGTLAIESAPGKGTRIDVWIPFPGKEAN